MSQELTVSSRTQAYQFVKGRADYPYFMVLVAQRWHISEHSQDAETAWLPASRPQPQGHSTICHRDTPSFWRFVESQNRNGAPGDRCVQSQCSFRLLAERARDSDSPWTPSSCSRSSLQEQPRASPGRPHPARGRAAPTREVQSSDFKPTYVSHSWLGRTMVSLLIQSFAN